ncbi:MAG: nuclear transport factor 2 family protein [Proteobacteria bacterium]|nr:nuclear transport factor 2 family protein [Pseudomonadota bacterium]
MRQGIARLGVLTLALVGAGAARACAPTPEAAVRQFVAALNALDEAGLIACLAEDVTLFNPDIPEAPSQHRLNGRSAVEASFHTVIGAATAGGQRRLPDVRPQNLDVRVFGSAALVTFEFPRAGTSFGRRSFVLAKRGRDWRIIHLHSSNAEG